MNNIVKRKILVTSNIDPDLDGYASAIGYANLLKKQGQDTKAILLGHALLEVQFMIDYLGSKSRSYFKKNLDRFDAIILVDTSNLDTVQKGIDPKKVREIIDHRSNNDSYLYPEAKVQIELVGACATLIYEKYVKSKMVPNVLICILLYGAIVSNTINFKNKITTKRDIQAAKNLKKLAHIPDDFIEKMFLAKSDLSGEKLSESIKYDNIIKKIANRNFSIGQLEIAHADKLINNRLEEISKIMNDILKESRDKVEYCFINIIDIFKGYNYIIVFNNKTKKLLENILNLEFKNNIAQTKEIIMRKELAVSIKEYFDS